jgi:hypothetical protein
MRIFLLACLTMAFACSTQGQTVFVEAESFTEPGGWVVDQQAMDIMGSPYVLAHGMGVPVRRAGSRYG